MSEELDTIRNDENLREAHTCTECGGALPPNPALALVDGYACDNCYGGRWDA